MADVHPVIISCAITGAIATPSMSPHLPITPTQIAKAAIGAAQAGAAIVHLSCPQPGNRRALARPGLVSPVPAGDRRRLRGGGQRDHRRRHPHDRRRTARRPLMARPEMCSLNMGSMNFNIAPAGERPRNWMHEWEQPYLARSTGNIFRNTFDDIARIVQTLGEHGTRFEFECYDVGHLTNLAYCLDRKIVRPPLFVQTIFGILGGIAADPRNLMFMYDTARRLFGDDMVWSVLAAGRHQMGYGTMAAVLGGNVRVGLEDSLYIGPGELATSNAQQVAKVVRILGELGMRVATPDEARAMLHLKGRDKVGF